MCVRTIDTTHTSEFKSGYQEVSFPRNDSVTKAQLYGVTRIRSEVIEVGYTQPPPLADSEIDSFLREQKIARICSLNEDGTIHATAVWFTYNDGVIAIITPAVTRKVRNISNNKNVTVFVDDPEIGKGVLIYGTAELEYNLDIQEVVSLYEKYLPREKAENLARAFARASKGGCIKIIVTAQRIVSFDSTKDKWL